jgi:1-deoxy-D-xylulose-5-phosphate reductoisomerase
LGVPDMRLPIAYALTYPQRLPLNSPPLDLCQVGQLTFEVPDTVRFPGLALGYAAARTGGTMPAVLNAANEMAVAAFLQGRIKFMDIAKTVEATMAGHQPQPLESLEQILAVNRWARDFAHDLINKGT